MVWQIIEFTTSFVLTNTYQYSEAPLFRQPSRPTQSGFISEFASEVTLKYIVILIFLAE
mgnify:CR=1 FL=1